MGRMKDFSIRHPGCWVAIEDASGCLEDTLDRHPTDRLYPGEWVLVRDAEGKLSGILDDTQELEELTTCFCCGRDMMPAGWTAKLTTVTKETTC